MKAHYVITGTDVRGKRFKPIHTSNIAYAMAHNVYKGTLWSIGTDGRRTRLLVWYN